MNNTNRLMAEWLGIEVSDNIVKDVLMIYIKDHDCWAKWNPDKDWNDIKRVEAQIEKEVGLISKTIDVIDGKYYYLFIPEIQPKFDGKGNTELSATYNAIEKFIKGEDVRLNAEFFKRIRKDTTILTQQ